MTRESNGTSNSKPSSGWRSWMEDACGEVEAAGRWRAPRAFAAFGHTGHLHDHHGSGDPQAVISFASNDYLGLSTHPSVVSAAVEAVERWGAGSGASRLVTGSRPVHHHLEEALAEWKGCEAAVVFPTGFAANLSVLSVLSGPGVTVCSDALNHASIIDGCRLARADVHVYPHGDLQALDEALAGAPGRAVVVSDTVFSMDGDAADVAGLIEVAGRWGALLVLDEAHAVLGPEVPVTTDPVVIRVGTLSKALGSLGGFVAGPRRAMELLVNRARPYIFTTAPAPASAAAALAALEVVRSPEGEELGRRLAHRVDRVATAVGKPNHPSPILPVVLGAEDVAVAASQALLDQGLWVPAIRPPTVAPGSSRLRITLSATHSDEQMDRLLVGLAGLLDSNDGPLVATVPVRVSESEATGAT